MKKILVAGALSIDMFADVQGIPRWDDMARSKSVRYVPGGKGLNKAVAASRLGGEVSLLGKLGKDDFGRQILKFLQSEEIDLKGVSTTDLPTSIVVFTVSKEGEESLLYVYGSDLALSENEVEKNKELIKESEIIVANYGIPVKSVEKLFSIAKKLGKITILNPSIPPPTLEMKFKGTDYLVLNKSEMLFYSGRKKDKLEKKEIADLAKKLESRGPRTVIVTLGDQGSICVAKDKVIESKGNSVKAVDTTGAGDSFVGAFAVSISKGNSLEESLEFANKVASLVVQKVGTVTSIPYLKDVENK